MSEGYEVTSEVPGRFEFCACAPAGGMSTTSADMARFMIAHLQEGRLDSARILKPEPIRLMHTRQFELISSMNGLCFGFIEGSDRAKR